MAIKTILNVNITVQSVQELHTILKELEEDSPIGPLESAIQAAKEFIDEFTPFTYEDVGLPYEMRRYREDFRDWALANNVEFKHTRTPGKRGSQGMTFYPFYIDGSGQKIQAKHPEEGVER